MTVAFLVALALSLGLRLWLAKRQVDHVSRHRDAVPPAFSDRIPLEAHEKAADYTVAKVRLSRWGLLARAGLLLAWTLGGGIEWLDTRLDGAWFLLAAFALTELVLLPFALYRVFVLEERFGFNRSTPRLFVLDLVKSVLLGVLLGWPVAAGALWLMGHGGALWWLWLWAGWMAFSLFLAWLYPALIAPLFNKFQPLSDEELKQRIAALLERTGFSSKGLFVMDGSRRSAHANAYFTGFGNRKRIVLFDTLCDMLAPPEVEAVLAHELGHFRRRHIWSRMAASAIFSLVGLALLAVILERTWFFDGLGVGHRTPHAGLLLFLWVSPLFTFPLNPLWSAWSRKQEYEADEFAAEHADSAALVGALVKMYEKNASTLTPDPLHSAYHDSHPPAALRIARLRSTG